MENYHRPVLLREVLQGLHVEVGQWYLDATLGDGGHSSEILRLGGNIVGVDVDPEAIRRTKERFDNEGISKAKWKLVVGNSRNLKKLVENQKFKGVLFDLGVSRLQLEESQRGFSFIREGPLDMRMDPGLSVSAQDLINGLNEGELYELFIRLGEEKYSRALACALVSTRKIGGRVQGIGIRNTKELAELVEEVYRKHGIRNWKIHPATKVFQALRIAVNDELNALKEALPQALDVLEEKGTVVVISFHSLEDRIVKQMFREWVKKGSGKILTKKPVVPSSDEIMRNVRSRSAKMRMFQKNHDNH